jgi:lipoprotein-anchoring transpeptidase ErfK/SrfK
MAARFEVDAWIRYRGVMGMILGGNMGRVAVVVMAGMVTSCAMFAPREELPPTPKRGPEVSLLLKLGERRVYVMQDDGEGTERRPLESYRVAIGRKEYKTPVGEFQVAEKVVDPDWVLFDWKKPERTIRRIPPGPNNPMGKRWIGFASAYGWGIGFHGTPKPEVLGQAVSHGCVRMHNDDIVKMFDKVEIGTPVVVVD